MKRTVKLPAHQFNLFRFEDVRPRFKVPLKKSDIEAAKRFIEKRDSVNAVKKLREIREGLENFLSRLK
jgi:hypothetical protein